MVYRTERIHYPDLSVDAAEQQVNISLWLCDENMFQSLKSIITWMHRGYLLPADI